MKWLHRLSNINLETKTADCSNCGPVAIKYSPNMKNARCRVAYLTAKYKSRYKTTTYEKEGVCEVCGSETRICYDHDHVTGDFRGWLCNACNVALGLVKDDPVLLRKLADYIEKK